MKYKLFTKSQPSAIEYAVQRWLKTQPDIQIVNSQLVLGQTFSYLSVWYTDKEDVVLSGK